MNSITSLILAAVPLLAPIVILVVVATVATITLPRIIKRLLRLQVRSRKVSAKIFMVKTETLPMYCIGKRLRFRGHHGGYRNTAKVTRITDLGYELCRAGTSFFRPFDKVRAA